MKRGTLILSLLLILFLSGCISLSPKVRECNVDKAVEFLMANPDEDIKSIKKTLSSRKYNCNALAENSVELLPKEIRKRAKEMREIDIEHATECAVVGNFEELHCHEGDRCGECLDDPLTDEVEGFNLVDPGEDIIDVRDVVLVANTIDDPCYLDSGDLNGDDLINILDIVILINFVMDLGGYDFTFAQECAADVNQDGIYNVLDVVSMINIILYGGDHDRTDAIISTNWLQSNFYDNCGEIPIQIDLDQSGSQNIQGVQIDICPDPFYPTEDHYEILSEELTAFNSWMWRVEFDGEPTDAASPCICASLTGECTRFIGLAITLDQDKLIQSGTTNLPIVQVNIQNPNFPLNTDYSYQNLGISGMLTTNVGQQITTTFNGLSETLCGGLGFTCSEGGISTWNIPDDFVDLFGVTECSTYNQGDTIDCSDTVNGVAYEDNCGTCDSDPSNNCVQDCAGVWGGDGLLDTCGTCDNDPSNDCVQDCAGVWGGNSVEDVCGVCDFTPENDGNFDECGTCDSDSSNDCVQDCTGAWGGTWSDDNCGTCLALGTSDPAACVQDCESTWGGTAYIDNCGVCDNTASNDDNTCTGCREAGACNYDSSATISCPSSQFSPSNQISIKEDNLFYKIKNFFRNLLGLEDIQKSNLKITNVAVSDISDCPCTYAEENYDCDGNCIIDVDCAGVCGGNAVLDLCGVCNGPGTTATDGCGNYHERFPFVSFNGWCLAGDDELFMINGQSYNDLCVDAGYPNGANYVMGSDSIEDYYNSWTYPVEGTGGCVDMRYFGGHTDEEGDPESLDYYCQTLKNYVGMDNYPACLWSGFNAYMNEEGTAIGGIEDYNIATGNGNYIWVVCSQGNNECTNPQACNYDPWGWQFWGCGLYWQIDVCQCEYPEGFETDWNNCNGEYETSLEHAYDCEGNCIIPPEDRLNGECICDGCWDYCGVCNGDDWIDENDWIWDDGCGL